MHARNHIKMASCLDDDQFINPKTFIESLPDSSNSFKSNNKLATNTKLSSLTAFQLKNDRNENKRVSIVCKSHHEEENSAKEVCSQETSLLSSQRQQQTHMTSLGTNIGQSSQLAKVQPKKKLKHQLKQIMTKQKVNILCNKFIQKIKRNNSFSIPVDYKGFQTRQKGSILQRSGFAVNIILDNTLAFLSIFQITFLFLAYSLSLVFTQIAEASLVNTLQSFSLIFYFCEIVYNSITVKSNAGRRLITFQQILMYYLQNNLIIDLISVLILIIDSNSDFIFMKFLRLFIIAKLPQCIQKIQKLQVFFIKNYHNQQYWSLIKVFIFNFCFAHILAIFLTAMANLNENNNWHVVKGINLSSWFQKYVWGYYWGTNIMLTVGFGDIVAVTYQQAICLIFIEIVSVMCLAYNINWVGTLISNIRSQDIEKGKNMKTFRQLSDKYELPVQLEWKISNYIQESVNIKKKFNVQQENGFIQKLPSNLKKQYLKESNRSIFQGLTFFGSLIDRTLYAFAQKIEMHISHPEQTLRRLDDQFNLLILRQGQIGYITRKRNCKYNEMVIDRLKVEQGGKPALLGLQFISKRRPIYEIKSIQYSVLYFLQYENLIATLKQSQMDYLHYCFLRDRNKSILDQFQVFKCDYCHSQHTKFTCPKLHFIPIQQHVIYKQQQRQKSGRNDRNKGQNFRTQQPKTHTLIKFKKTKKAMKQQQKIKDGQPTKTIKMANPFIDRLDQIKKLKQDTISDGGNDHTIQQFFLKNTTEIIKQEFNRFIRQQSYQDEVWIIQCDKMKNFKEYFAECNPCNLQDSFNVQIRLELSKMRMLQDDTIMNMDTLQSPSFKGVANGLTQRSIRTMKSMKSYSDQ